MRLKKSLLFFVFTLISNQYLNAQTFHRFSYTFGLGIIPVSNEYANTNDALLEKSWKPLSFGVGYSIDKLPISLNLGFMSSNRRSKLLDRDVIYSEGGDPERSELELLNNYSRMYVGFNFSLFKPRMNLISDDSDQGYTSTQNKRRRKKTLINPFIGFGLSETNFFSKLNFETKDFDPEFNEGTFRSVNFSDYKSSTLFYNFGCEIELFNLNTINSEILPIWDFVVIYFRYNAQFQNTPNIYLHTRSTINQDFVNTHQPYMENYNSGELAKLPITKWTHYFEINMVYSFSYKLNKIRNSKINEKLKAQQTEEE